MSRKIKFLLLLLLAVTTSAAAAQEQKCKQWLYSSLSFTATASVESEELKDVYTFVLWEAPNEIGMWQSNKPLSGTIDTTLTKHFGVKTVHPLSILNSLGQQGWEAYGFHLTQSQESVKTREWQFRQCRPK